MAGGPGFGTRVFPGAGVLPGFTLVASYWGLRQLIAQRQRIITGEEGLDVQTLSGKVIRAGRPNWQNPWACR